MRLIDADKLVRKIKRMSTHAWQMKLTGKAETILNSVIDCIEKAPMVDPQLELEEFEWCTDCKEYDQKQHCCHRFTKTIRQTLEELEEFPTISVDWIYEYVDRLKSEDDAASVGVINDMLEAYEGDNDGVHLNMVRETRAVYRG